VTIHGTLDDTIYAISCPAVLSGARPAPVHLTFMDGNGHIIGTTVTTPENGEQLSPTPVPAIIGPTCQVLDPYMITLPTVPFYQVSIEGGTTPLPPMSLQQLASQGYEWDFPTGSH